MKKPLIAFGLILIALVCGFAPPQDRINQLLETLKDSKSDQVMVVAHRGDWRNAPENSIQAIEGAIKMGVDMVEIDIRKTKDGHLVLMHDKTLDRTTNGTGKIAEWTLDSLKTLRLRNGQGRVTPFTIPTLEEAMLAAKGKILVNLDKCYDYFAEAYQILERTGTTRQVVMKAKKPLHIVKNDFGQYLDKVIFMPIVDLDRPTAPQIIEAYQKEIKPVAFEFIFKKEASVDIKLLKKVRRNGARVWINSLWASLNAGHDDDLALSDIEASYGWILKQEATLVQTDRPQLWLQYLKAHKRHH